MKVSKNCRNDSSCVTLFDNDSLYHFQLADGTFINMSGEKGGFTFDILINKKGEHNLPGKVYFTGGFSSSGDVMVPSNFFQFDFPTTLGNVKECVSSDPYTYNCRYSALVWIIRYGNMDYLKLSPTTGKCPNGNTLTESNPRCN